MMLKIAIIGRPNVGKSTLFNRLAGKKLALVDDQPGVTRDRREAEAWLGDLKFLIVDTAGLEQAGAETLEGRMHTQTNKAIEEADLCLFMVDAKTGITAQDRVFANIVRASDTPALLLANKTEGRALANVYESYELGLGEPLAIAAEHGQGMDGLYEAIQPFAASYAQETPDAPPAWDDPLKPLRVAIVGRPNAGKSTLVNTLLNDDRLLTGPEAGITRDTISVTWSWQSKTRNWPVKLFDTAGMRKRARVQEKLEKLSVADGIRAVRFAEIVAVLFDATTPLEKQDLHIADLAVSEGRAVVLVANKWDLVEDPGQAFKQLRMKVDRLLPQIPGVPLVTLSAQTGKGIQKLMPAITQTYVDWNAKVKTSDLNHWLQEALTRHPPPAVSGRRIRIKYIAQTKTRPPTFVAQCQRADDVPTSYRRYLVNGIRQAFEINAVPIRLYLHKQNNPYV